MQTLEWAKITAAIVERPTANLAPAVKAIEKLRKNYLTIIENIIQKFEQYCDPK